ncbi:IS4 family transposase [soil metagenome]
MLYTIFNRCTSIREVVTGILACQSKLQHLGVRYSIRKSTLSDANGRRSSSVFEAIYVDLYNRYAKSLPDSRARKWFSRLYIMDSTTISLFQEILKGSGLSTVNGKRKGGMKAHTLMKADEDVPQVVRLTAAAANDTNFMSQIQLPKGSILTFDRGYNDYSQLIRWNNTKVTWVTRLRKLTVFETLENSPISPYHQKHGVVSDTVIRLGWHKKIQLRARVVVYYDEKEKRTFEFLTNNFEFSPLTIAQIYSRRWQIETLFKRLKQNYPLRHFLGDNENAIRIQVWCALIADLLLKIISRQIKKMWSFANLSSMIRLHLMTYINLRKFLNNPERALQELNSSITYLPIQKSLFIT